MGLSISTAPDASFGRQRAAAAPAGSDLEAEEMLLTLLRVVLQRDATRRAPSAATAARLIRRTKEFLHAQQSKRVLFAEVGRAVGATPAGAHVP